MASSQERELWGSEDPDYLEALVNYTFSSEKKSPSVGTKRKRTASPEPESDVNPTLFTGPRPPKETVSSKNENYVYGAANFGGFGEYMFRKRAKLQIQNVQLADEDEGTKKPQIFKGVAIYVNGFTDPPFQDLREMIMAYGGVFHAYLDRKSMVTHVIASQLTPAKILEYQRAKLKVVKPEWIVKSVEAEVLQRWQDYTLQPGAVGTVAALGQGTDFSGGGSRTAVVDVDQPSIRAPQKTLAEAFASRKHSQAASSKPPTVQKPPEPIQDPLELTSPEMYASDLLNTTPGPSRSPHGRILNKHLGGSDGSPSPTRRVTDPNTPGSGPNASAAPEPTEQPSYAMYDSNPVAAKLMESTEWRRQHTSANPQAFTESYFQNSRLHHLSAWKSELRQLVADAREQAEKAEELATQSGDSKPTMDVDVTSMQGARLPRMLVPKRDKGKGKESDRVIMHVDFDSFFVAAGLVDRPQLKGKPVVVCHSGAGKVSTSEIASASYEARTFGIKNGMSLGQARQLCPNIQPIPYEFEKYKAFSLKFYTILMAFADDLQAVSVDEAILDVSERVAQLKMASDDPGDRDFAKELAEHIRDKVRENTGCEVSVGISHNIMLARMATRHAKPAKSYHLLPGDVPSHLAPLEIKAIHGVGRSIRDKIRDKFGVETLGELLEKSKDSLQRLLGEKTGDKIWKAVRGIDDTPLESDKPRKSVSAEVNYGIRFENNEQAEAFVMNLATEVSKRLKAVSKRGRFMTLKIMVRRADAPLEAAKFLGHGSVDCYNKSASISDGRGGATDDAVIIGEESWRLLKAFNFDPKELRGIGIQIQKLDNVASATELPRGQARLSFRTASKVGEAKRPIEFSDEDVEILEIDRPPSAPPSRSSNIADLPSASQIDQSVLDSLPEDIKREILDSLAQNNQKVIQPKPTRSKTVPSSRLRNEIDLTAEGDGSETRSQSLPPSGSQTEKGSADMLGVPQHFTKAVSMSPTKAQAGGPGISKAAAARHITKQLAPKHKVPFVSPNKHGLFKDRTDVDDVELRALGVDPLFFRELPKDIQKEQLSILRQQRSAGTRNSLGPFERAASRASSRSRSPSLGPLRTTTAPIPVASYTTLPQIKKLSKVDDVQNMVRDWVKYRKTEGPSFAEVDRICTYLVKCAGSDIGLENVTSIMRYWRMILREKWRDEEGVSKDEIIDVDGNTAGLAWWNAFRNVKRKVDEVVKKRFGCGLALGRT
ncbi:hypothetical protein M407DRAFT_18608 [Tulasnella calospora MUT 4182]|uniref:DNA repair protein REV1 n=1 Tax=Tulasnella calospora MUT 4182 TaxID=1051891 RepID=A0A0C3MFR8_9AGAM|nr:hypothetical protein M407DRAFT_18608 [Tulasnella calospora MUT 4182]